MPFTNAEIQEAAYHSLDNHLKNNPIDQVASEKPLLKWFLQHKKTFGGALQFVTEQLRTSYDSNFQWYFGDDEVTYNTKNTLNQAKFTWAGFHDGFSLNEDELLQNGIIVTDKVKRKSSTDAERIQLANLLDEQMETLTLGIEEKLDLELHRDGSQSGKSIIGLDALVGCDPTTGVIGGIDRATNPWWRNHVASKLTEDNILEHMEKVWRACIRSGARPDFIPASGDFIDIYAKAVKKQGRINVNAGNKFNIEGGNGEHTFKDVPITYNPTFETLDDSDCPAMPWAKRAYFLNSKTLRMRPVEGHWMEARQPPREHNQYVHRFATTGKLAVTMNLASANALLTLA